MRLPNDSSKYTAQFKYVEVARNVPELKKLVREKKDGNPLLIPWEEVPAYANQNENTGIYTSIFQYNSNDFAEAAYLGPFYFDLDADNLATSFDETKRLVQYLLTYIPESGIRVYFSGGKGFHVECEPITLGISTTDDLGTIFRFMGRHISEQLELTTTDYAVYDRRRMWRLPNSRHQRTGLFKTECMPLLLQSSSIDPIVNYAEQSHPIDVPEQQFNYKANQWYREFIYMQEAAKQKQPDPQNMFARFLEQGTGFVKSFFQKEKGFDKFKLFKHCPAVRELERKAKVNHHLDHYERLFLCSLLTYTDDAVRYLHELLSECSDYQFEITNAHIEDWVKRREYGIGGRPFTCEKAQQVGIGCSGCDKLEPLKKMIQLAGEKYVETEEYSSPSPIRFCYTNKGEAI